MLAKDLTQKDFDAFSTIERLNSALSLVGAAFIVSTYLGSKAFHKPINRLVFYASIGNMLTNVATIISRNAVHDPNGGLCQFQAFLIQCFMPADSFWTLAMATNVYLTFYHHFDEAKLRRIEPLYMVLCYGIPFVPAMALIWTKTAEKGRMYGNATLWCWISPKWDIYRIITFYAPVWLIISTTIAIYIRVGLTIYQKRKALLDFGHPAPEPMPLIQDPFTSMKTTEIFVTSEAATQSFNSIDLQRLDQDRQYPHAAAPGTVKSAYTVTVSTCQTPPPHLSYSEKSPQEPVSRISVPMSPVASSMFSPNPQQQSNFHVRRYATMEANSAMKSYAKVAGLFFVALLITWIPSSANRVYSVVHKNEVSRTLTYLSAFVLPLQGFWNAVIYAMTSLTACGEAWDSFWNRKRGNSIKPMASIPGRERGHRGATRLQSTSGSHSSHDSDSMTQLANQLPSRRGTSSPA